MVGRHEDVPGDAMRRIIDQTDAARAGAPSPLPSARGQDSGAAPGWVNSTGGFYAVNYYHEGQRISWRQLDRDRRRAAAPTRVLVRAVIRITLTTICGTDLHILRGEYPVKAGLVIGHEPVGVIEELGDGVTGYKVGQRVLVGAITPCGQCLACLSGHLSQCGHGEGYEAIGGWRFGNTINGSQAEYLLVPNAQANLAKIPDDLTDEQVVLLADIASTGFSGAESGGTKLGDAVVVFAQGPIGLCATAGAKLMGASLIIGVDADEKRLEMARRMGADVVLNPRMRRRP